MSSTEPHSSEQLSSLQRRIVLIGMMSGMSLAAVDQMILSTAVASISGELGELTQAPWLFTANLLTSSASMPIWGKLGDLYGRRRIFQLAIVIFVVASLLASRSETMLELVACRSLQGLGGGALLTLPWAIIGDIVAPRARPAYLAFVSAVWAGAGFIGPPLGGFLVDGPGWRWMFYLNIPVGLVAIALIRLGYRIPVRRIEHKVDISGALLLFGSVGSLILYTSWAGSSWGFGSLGALLLLGMSGLLAICFFVHERQTSEPIIELSMLRMRAIWPPLLTTCVFGFGNFAIAIFLPLFAIVVRGSSAIEAGLGLMPLAFGLFASALVVGRWAAATQHYRRYIVRGLVLYIVGLVLLSTMGPETPRLTFWSYSLLLGLGSGSIAPMVVASLQNAVHERHLGVASSLPGFSRAVAQTIGTSILGAFLGLRIVQHLETLATPLMAADGSLERFIKSPDAIRALREPLHSAVVESYRMAFAETFSVMIGIMAISLAAAFFIRDTRVE